MSDLSEFYAEMWRESRPRYHENTLELDPYLADRHSDRRRGITVIIRLQGTLVDRVMTVIERFGALDPAQFVYPRAQLHTTLLSLNTASPDFVPDSALLRRYQTLLTDFFQTIPAFTIEYRGIIGTPAAVILCGYPQEDRLNQIRDALRVVLTAQGLGANLDQRYRIISAHSTLMRFTQRLRDPAAMIALIDHWRDQPLGVLTVSEVEFVINDWYLTPERVQTLARYPLKI
ncbi:MAG: hypothetical protein MUF87_16090 [Anaerolineae bacterium]|jgi:2'-5' RNA ligase|nr:hypothetical protein [Anaerolineae bacterium]